MGPDRDGAYVRPPGLDEFDPPPCPGAYLSSDSRFEGTQHAQPGSQAATLCGLPSDSVVLVRNLFYGRGQSDCRECARLIWLRPPRRDSRGVTGWHATLAEARVVLVVAGSSFDPTRRRRHRVLARVDLGPAIDELRAALTLGPLRDGVAMMTPGDPTLALYAEDRELIATVHVLSGGWIRSHLLPGDQRVATPDELTNWLERHVPVQD